MLSNIKILPIIIAAIFVPQPAISIFVNYAFKQLFLLCLISFAIDVYVVLLWFGSTTFLMDRPESLSRNSYINLVLIGLMEILLQQ